MCYISSLPRFLLSCSCVFAWSCIMHTLLQLLIEYQKSHHASPSSQATSPHTLVLNRLHCVLTNSRCEENKVIWLQTVWMCRHCNGFSFPAHLPVHLCLTAVWAVMIFSCNLSNISIITRGSVIVSVLQYMLIQLQCESLCSVPYLQWRLCNRISFVFFIDQMKE